MVLDVGIFLFLHSFRHFHDYVLDKLKLFLLAYERNHNLGYDIVTLLILHLDCRFHHSPGLHLGNLGIGNRQTASPVSHHGIELMEGIADLLHFLRRHHHFNRQIVDIRLLGGHELM